ncbi:hypothetical protein EDB85DRAFT_1052514 [Lactarius pseudohatsudake]|nr:hypothetical protein EDB85DRAFT_1052514 [Lactarius pseudohatsudake]
MQKARKPGKRLPPKSKRIFSNKQIVCIESVGSEDDECRLFRLKAEAPTLLLNFIHGLVQEFSMHLRFLGFNDQRDAAFRWITLSLQTTLDPRPIVMRTTATAAAQLTTWLKDSALLDPPWKKRQQHSYKLLIDTLSEYSECLKVSHGPATIAPIDLVMMVLSSSRLVGALGDEGPDVEGRAHGLLPRLPRSPRATG